MKQCLLLFTFLCVAILPSFSQQKIDILGNAGKEQEIKLSEVAKSVLVIPLETTEECLLGTDLKIYYGEEYIFVCDQRQPGAFYRFSKDGKFLNKIGCSGEGPEEYIRNAYTYQVVLRENDIIYANNMFYHSSKNYELLRASRQDGKLIQRVRSTVPEEYKIRLLLREPLLYTYQNEVYYKNPLKNVICVLRDGLKQYRRYELNIGMVDNENRDDYFNPKKNRNMINIAGVYETEDFLLFFYGYKEKAYWMLCSKQDWMCKANNYEDCFTDDLSPSEEKFVCRSFTSVTQRHLISIREDKEGDANPTLLVAELK